MNCPERQRRGIGKWVHPFWGTLACYTLSLANGNLRGIFSTNRDLVKLFSNRKRKN